METMISQFDVYPNLSNLESTMLTEIKRIESEFSCPDLSYSSRNLRNLIKLQQQFYSAEAQKAMTCIVQSYLSNATQIESGDFVRKLAQNVKTFLNDPQIFSYLNLRQITLLENYNDNVEQLIREAYVAIKYLNPLRTYTPAFKYVYGILITDSKPYLFEENLGDVITMPVLIKNLFPDQGGVRVIKSLLLQIFFALRYASKVGVSNFPKTMVVRRVPTNSNLPYIINNKVIYVATYGHVATFEQLYPVSFPIEDKIIGTPQTFSSEMSEFTEYIMSLVESLNFELYQRIIDPKLFEQLLIERPLIEQTSFRTIIKSRLPTNFKLSGQFFEEVILKQPTGQSLSCFNFTSGEQVCQTVDEFLNYFQVPYARIENEVRGMVDHIDYLYLLMNNNLNNPDLVFIISPVILKYIQLLEQIYSELTPELQVRIFPEERFYDLGFSPERYIALETQTIKPDYKFIQEVKINLYQQYQNPEFILEMIQLATNEGNKLLIEQRSRPIPELTSLENIEQAILNFRDIISDIFYFKTTNAIINWYKYYISDVRMDLTLDILELEELRVRYEELFDLQPNILDKYLTQIDTSDEAVLARLYDVFIGDLSDPLEVSLRGYENRRSPQERQQIIEEAYRQKKVVSDPIELIVNQIQSRSLLPGSTFAPTFAPTPAFIPTFTPAPTFAPAFTPAFTPAPTFAPAFTPAPTFSPTFVPAFAPPQSPVNVQSEFVPNQFSTIYPEEITSSFDRPSATRTPLTQNFIPNQQFSIPNQQIVTPEYVPPVLLPSEFNIPPYSPEYGLLTNNDINQPIPRY